MAVLVRTMVMPKSCSECPCCNLNKNNELICVPGNFDIGDMAVSSYLTDRHYHCPLQDVFETTPEDFINESLLMSGYTNAQIEELLSDFNKIKKRGL